MSQAVSRAAPAALSLALSLVMGACGHAEDPLSAYNEADARVVAAASPEERIARIREHFEVGGRSKLSMRLLDQAVEILVEDLDDPEEAVRMVTSAVGRFQPPELQRKVKAETLLPLLIRVGRAEEFQRAEGEFQEEHPLGFWEHQRYAVAAGDAGLWPLCLAEADRAADLAGMAADHAASSREQRATQKEAFWASVQRGRALSHLGRLDEGLAAFSEAHELVPVLDPSPIGVLVLSSRLKVHWGEALAADGRLEEAIQMLAQPALISDDEAALAALEEAHLRATGTLAGFEEELRELHRRASLPFGDFILADYAGASHRFSDVAEGRVAVVVFWFPGCTLCIAELPRLQPLWERYRDQGVVVVALEVSDDPVRARHFVRDRQLSFVFLRDRPLPGSDDRAGTLVARRFGLWAYPVTLVVDADGLIRYVHVDYSPGAEARIEDQVRRLCEERALAQSLTRS